MQICEHQTAASHFYEWVGSFEKIFKYMKSKQALDGNNIISILIAT